MLLMEKLLPAIRSIAGDVFVFQQDNAPAHRARDTVELLRCETPQFIGPDMWPANSRDLNSVAYRYCVRGMTQKCVYQVPISNTHELRQRFVATWAEFQHSVVDDATNQWPKRLEANTLGLCMQIVVVSMSHPSSHRKRHLDRFSGFCKTHYYDRPTDRPHYSICNNRPHLRKLSVGLLRCGLSIR